MNTVPYLRPLVLGEDRKKLRSERFSAARVEFEQLPTPSYTDTQLEDYQYLVFADRYSKKDTMRETLQVGDTVVALIEEHKTWRQTELCKVLHREGDQFTLKVEKTGEVIVRPKEHLDKFLELKPMDMWDRVAKAIASVEPTPELRASSYKDFAWMLDDFKLLPGGRINTAADLTLPDALTLFNCFVIDYVRPTSDILEFIDALVERGAQAMEIQSRGGGVGLNLSTIPPTFDVDKHYEPRNYGKLQDFTVPDDRKEIIYTLGHVLKSLARGFSTDVVFSSLRPKRAYVRKVNGRSSGPVTFSNFYSFMVSLVEYHRTSRPLAFRAIMNDWHPDVLEWIKSESNEYPQYCTRFVEISEELKKAAERGGEWVLKFPDTSYEDYDSIWDGDINYWENQLGRKTVEYARVDARDLYQSILECNDVMRQKLSEENMYGYGNFSDQILHGLGAVEAGAFFSEISSLVEQGGSRRGALLLMLNSWHASLRKFATIKQNPGVITSANLSINYTEDFLSVVVNKKKRDRAWNLCYPDVKDPRYSEFNGNLEDWVKSGGSVIVQEVTTVRKIWEEETVLSAWKSAEPGVIFLEYYDRVSNSYYYTSIICTNPCAEQGLPPWAVCNLNSINLSKFYSRDTLLFAFDEEFLGYVRDKHDRYIDHLLDPQRVAVEDLLPRFEMMNVFDKDEIEELVLEFKKSVEYEPVGPNIAIRMSQELTDKLGHIDWNSLEKLVRTAVRFADNVTDFTMYPLPQNEEMQLSERRVGLGILGLHDLMLSLGIKYGSRESLYFIDMLVGFITRTAYKASSALASERGSFPKFDCEKFLNSVYMQRLVEDFPSIGRDVRTQGIANVTLMTIAPTGTIGTMAGVSTGCEPYFAHEYTRTGRLGTHTDYSRPVREWFDANPGKTKADLPDYFTTAMDMSAQEHIEVQARLQRFIDSSISKTVNAPGDFGVGDTDELYTYAIASGCKGVTIYRDGSRDSQVLTVVKEEKPAEPEPEMMIGLCTFNIDENGNLIKDCGVK